EHARHEAKRGRARATRRVERGAARLAACRPALAPTERKTSSHGSRANRARPEHRIPLLPNTGRDMASPTARTSSRRSAGPRLARRGVRTTRALHAESGTGSEAAHFVDGPRCGVRNGTDIVRARDAGAVGGRALP